MTLNEAAKEAITVQDACNLSGVVHAFSRIMSEVLWPEAHQLGKGTDWVNQHPISVMFSSKIASLTGSEVDSSFGEAYAKCSEMAEKENA